MGSCLIPGRTVLHISNSNCLVILSSSLVVITCPVDFTVSAAYGNYSWPLIESGSYYNQSCAYGSIGDQVGSGDDLVEFGSGINLGGFGSGGDLGGFGIGFAQRVCSATGNWEEPNFSYCQNGEPAMNQLYFMTSSVRLEHGQAALCDSCYCHIMIIIYGVSHKRKLHI